MNTQFIYYAANGKRKRLSKDDIIEYLMYTARYAFPCSYLRRLRRWSYDASRYALNCYIRQYAPDMLDKFENLYDPYIVHSVCRQ